MRNLPNMIPLYKPQNTIGAEVLNTIREVLESGWLTMGPKTLDFEKTFAEYIGCKYGVATNSCTSALYLALDALGMKSGVSVAIPVNTFVATANVVRLLGAEVSFCDVAEDGEIDVAELETLLKSNDNIKCIIPVQLYGFPCKMKEIRRLAKEYDVKMIEDCAQSVGAEYEGNKIGSFGDASCFSFYATKNITTGEGGMMVTNSEKLKNRAFLVRNHGQTKSPKQKVGNWRYDVCDLGFNFRMSEIQAAMGLNQMSKLSAIIESRREIAKKYKEELDKINGLEMLHDPTSDFYQQGVFHLLEVKVEKQYPLKRDALYSFLKKKGIITGVHYPPLHLFSYYRKTTKYKKGDFPRAEELYSKILSLPMFPWMTEQEFQTVISALKAGACKK
jgi:dTDP-4-amino-4,6-dideoxygalactose transaminase